MRSRDGARNVTRPQGTSFRTRRASAFDITSRPVSKIAKAAGTSKPEDLSFEDALKKLEAIVEAMEAGDLPLESLLARFEEGTCLAKICQARLTEAELKIQQLEKNATGDLTLKPLTVAEDSIKE
jgi:exodeoxyribonuclease VII small subunit